MATRTAFLGKLLGLYLIAVSLSIFAHPHAITKILKGIIQDPSLLFVTGLLGVTAGLAIVLAHNVWSDGALPIIVTIFGWASLLKGMLLLILSPETEFQLFIAGFHLDEHPDVYAAFLLLFGAYLAYAGFSFKGHFPK